MKAESLQVKTSIYLPDDLGRRVKDARWLNVSQVCRDALLAALELGDPAVVLIEDAWSLDPRASRFLDESYVDAGIVEHLAVLAADTLRGGPDGSST